jgi:calcineurin-like phosphoesterase family protein
MDFPIPDFLTSDLHLGHANAATKFRGFDTVEAHNEALIENWRSVVPSGALVYLLGDAVMGTFAENVHLLGQLTGDIWLLPGNHDRVHPTYHHKNPAKLAEFRAAYEQYVTIFPECEVTVAGGGVTLCHFPPDGDHTDEDRYPEFRPVDNGQQFLHGHVHDLWRDREDGRWVNVGVDVWGFAPVSYDHLSRTFGFSFA